jgi:hypothetical protein
MYREEQTHNAMTYDALDLYRALSALRKERDELEVALMRATKKADKLDVLHACGVDNWEGYEYAMSCSFDEED